MAVLIDSSYSMNQVSAELTQTMQQLQDAMAGQVNLDFFQLGNNPKAMTHS